MKFKIAVYFIIIMTCISGFSFRSYSDDNLKSDYTNVNNAKVDSLLNSGLTAEMPGLPGLSDMIIQIIFSLSIVVVLIIALVFFLKKFVYKRRGMQISDGLIKVIDTVYIAPKKSIQIIKALDRILIVGVTENQMQTLAEFREEEIPASFVESKKEVNNNFSKCFSVLFDKVKKSQVQESN